MLLYLVFKKSIFGPKVENLLIIIRESSIQYSAIVFIMGKSLYHTLLCISYVM